MAVIAEVNYLKGENPSKTITKKYKYVAESGDEHGLVIRLPKVFSPLDNLIGIKVFEKTDFTGQGTHTSIDIPGIRDTFPGQGIFHRDFRTLCTACLPEDTPVEIPMSSWHFAATEPIIVTLKPGGILDSTFSFLPSYKPEDQARRKEVKVRIRKE